MMLLGVLFLSSLGWVFFSVDVILCHALPSCGTGHQKPQMCCFISLVIPEGKGLCSSSFHSCLGLTLFRSTCVLPANVCGLGVCTFTGPTYFGGPSLCPVKDGWVSTSMTMPLISSSWRIITIWTVLSYQSSSSRLQKLQYRRDWSFHFSYFSFPRGSRIPMQISLLPAGQWDLPLQSLGRLPLLQDRGRIRRLCLCD